MIIGLVGPFCSGKDSVGAILSEKGFSIFSFGDVLRQEMTRKGLPLVREEIQKFGNQLRKEEGSAAIAKRIIAEMHPGKNYLVQGFRNPQEVEEFRKLGFFLITIDAPARVRFERMLSRRREKDPTTYEDFVRLEDKELRGIGESAGGLRIKDCMAMADEVIINDGTLDVLERKIDAVLRKLSAKNNLIK
jgi:dephospho-CoA kinase